MKRTNKKTDARFVYALCDPMTLDVFYVGSTGDLLFRFRSHLVTKGNDRDKKVEMVAQIRAAGLLPTMIVLEVTTEKKRLAVERKWTVAMMAKGHSLLNTRPLRISDSDLRKSFGINCRLVELAGLAADALHSTECETNRLLACRLRNALGDVARMVESI